MPKLSFIFFMIEDTMRHSRLVLWEELHGSVEFVVSIAHDFWITLFLEVKVTFNDTDVFLLSAQIILSHCFA